MKRLIQSTSDGSQTIFVPEMRVTYHSTFGAVQESRHVFIDAGLKPLIKTKEVINVFEMGFGTGLNALMTFQQSVKLQQKIYYCTVELYPLAEEEYSGLNFAIPLQDELLQPYFLHLHESDWEKDTSIGSSFCLHKSRIGIEEFSAIRLLDLIYYDAFDPAVQPALWTEAIFKKLFSMLLPGGILVTYSSKGAVRRAMLAAGFSIEKLKGPPGKREITRAIKKL